MRFPSRLLARSLLAAGSLLAALGGAEVATRVWLDRYASEAQFQRFATYSQYLARYVTETPRHSGHYYIGYQATPSWTSGRNRHNALGFRGDEIDQPKPAGRYRIACLGGSTTYTTKVDDYRLAYPQLLQEELRGRTGADVDVVNAGLAGWASHETLVNFLFRLTDLEPDLVVVYHGVNDLHNRLVWPLEAYRPDNFGRHPPSEIAVFAPPIWEYSTFLRTLLVATGATPAHKDRVASFRKAPETWVSPLYCEQWRSGEYPAGVFETMGADEILRRNPPRHFRRNLEDLVTVAHARGIEVVLMTFAHSPHFADNPWSADPLHQAGYAEMNAVTAAVAGEKGARLFDFARVFPKEKAYWSDDGIHVNRAGSRRKAELVAAYLVAQGLIPER